MLFVGLPEQQAVARLLKSVSTVKVGDSGRVLLLNASGASAGTWMLSPDGKDAGKVAIDAKDADGKAYVKELVATALGLSDKASATARFRPAPGAAETVACVRYFKPWDRVIAVSIPEDEMLETADRITRLSSQAVWVLAGVVALTGAVAGLVWLFTARRLTGRVRPLVEQLASAAAQVTVAASELAGASEQLARGASDQASSSDAASGSLTQIADLTSRNAEVAQGAAVMAKAGRTAADAGIGAMERMQAAMDDIQGSGKSVAKSRGPSTTSPSRRSCWR